jgi:hypothetical protein
MKATLEGDAPSLPTTPFPACAKASSAWSSELEADVRKFFSEHSVKQGAKQMEQHLERLHIAVACRERWKNLLRE